MKANRRQPTSRNPQSSRADGHSSVNRQSSISNRESPFAFTLVELMVVLTLMSLAVGMTVVGLDGFSQRGRVRSALGQIASVDALARTQALCDGRPRRLGFARDTGRCTICCPQRDADRWRWSSPAPLTFGHGVTVRDVVVDGTAPDAEPLADEYGVRIRADGTSASYAVVLGVGERAGAAIVVNGWDGSSRYVFEIPAEPADLFETGAID